MSAKDELLNDYERERAERIKRNQAMLAQLKVPLCTQAQLVAA